MISTSVGKEQLLLLNMTVIHSNMTVFIFQSVIYM